MLSKRRESIVKMVRRLGGPYPNKLHSSSYVSLCVSGGGAMLSHIYTSPSQLSILS